MKIKAFFSNRRNLTILISVVSFLIVAALIVLIWMIYTKDEPKVIPEDVKGKIRKGIEDTGNAVKVVSPTVGQAIVDASFDNQPAQSTSPSTSSSTSDTSDWKTYTSSLGFSVKYPGNLESVNNSVSHGELASVGFWAKPYKGSGNGTFSDFSVVVLQGSDNVATWLGAKNNPAGAISDIRGAVGGWTRATEMGDPDHTIYVKTGNGKIYQITTALSAPSYINEVLESFIAN